MSQKVRRIDLKEIYSLCPSLCGIFRLSRVKQFEFDQKFAHGIFKIFKMKYIYIYILRKKYYKSQ